MVCTQPHDSWILFWRNHCSIISSVFMLCSCFIHGTLHITWSCLPHITCKGAVIRCKCSCKAYLDFSPTISINTNGKKQGLTWSILYIQPTGFSWNKTNLLGKMCYGAAEHLPALEESKQRSRRRMYQGLVLFYSIMIFIHSEHIQSRNHGMFVFKRGPDLLRNFKPNMRTKSEHVLHLLWCCRDQRDV